MIGRRYAQIVAWANLLEAYRKAARGKRGHAPAAAFEDQIADHLLALQRDLAAFTYTPGAYIANCVGKGVRRQHSTLNSVWAMQRDSAKFLLRPDYR